MKVVDSTFLIDVLRGKKETLLLLERKEQLVTTQINMYEIIRGLFLRNISQEKQAAALELFDHLRVVPFDNHSVIKAAEISAELIKKGTRVSDCDCMTAGCALSRGIKIIVTKNKKDFERMKDIEVEMYG